MLKKIPHIIPPELLKILSEMGHGDEIVIGDGNFPSSSLARRIVRMDASGVEEVLSAVLELFPLDTYAPNVILMEKMACDEALEIPIWKKIEEIADKGDPGFSSLVHIDRFAFYDRAAAAYAVIATGERQIYANVILKKGVI